MASCTVKWGVLHGMTVINGLRHDETELMDD